jgi:hypothetical protein
MCVRGRGASRDTAHVTFRDTPEHSDSLKLRLWVWQRWSNHRAGTATVKWLTMEGDSGTSDYTIAQDRDGVWYLSIHLEGSERPMFDGDTEKWRDEWTIAHSVQRVEEPYHWDWPGKPISDSKKLSARKFVLELKDKERKILGHI